MVSVRMNNTIIATRKDETFHVEKINHFLDKLQVHNLFLKLEKCQFHQKEVEYLRVIIGNGKVKMDLVKVEGIANWPVPKTVKDVLGFCNFYRACYDSIYF
jgi:hypothetical protein